jgi:hypothetical protein
MEIISNNLNLPNATQKKIESFAGLRAGWHFGEGMAPSTKTLRSALTLHKKIRAFGFPKTDAFPGVGGEIRLTIYDGEEYHEFTFEANDSITYVHEIKGVEDVELLNLDINNVHDILANLKNPITWFLSEFFPQDIILTQISSDFKIWPSKTLGDPYRYLLKNVRLNEAVQSVDTYETFIATKPKNRQLLFEFPNPFSLQPPVLNEV